MFGRHQRIYRLRTRRRQRSTVSYTALKSTALISSCSEFQTELVLKDYFWRNTKESVKNELTIPDTVDEVKFVNFSTIERAIYMCMYDVNGMSNIIGIEMFLSNNPNYLEYAQLETCSFNRSGKDLREQMVAHINNLTVCIYPFG